MAARSRNQAKALLAEFTAPELSTATLEELDEYVSRRKKLINQSAVC